MRALYEVEVRSCCGVVFQVHDLRATTAQYNAKRHFVLQRSIFTLHTTRLTFCTSHLPLHLSSSHLSASHLISPHLTSSHLVSAPLISSPFKCHLRSSQLLSSHPSTPQRNPFHQQVMGSSCNFFTTAACVNFCSHFDQQRGLDAGTPICF